MSVKAWNDEEEAKLIKMYTEMDVKDVYVNLYRFAWFSMIFTSKSIVLYGF